MQDEKFGRASGAAIKRTSETKGKWCSNKGDGRRRDILRGMLEMSVNANAAADDGDQNLKTASTTDVEDPWMVMRRRAEMDLQLSVYVSGSANAARIAGRPTLLRNMFQDMLALRIVVSKLTEWDAALWTRSRVNSGTKTAGAVARTALDLAENEPARRFSRSPAL